MEAAPAPFPCLLTMTGAGSICRKDAGTLKATEGLRLPAKGVGGKWWRIYSYFEPLISKKNVGIIF